VGFFLQICRHVLHANCQVCKSNVIERFSPNIKLFFEAFTSVTDITHLCWEGNLQRSQDDVGLVRGFYPCSVDD